MFGNRDQIRQMYCSVFSKMKNDQACDPLEQQIAEVIAEHPEYHALLESSDSALDKDFTPDSGESNPFLHMGMHLGIREQVSTNRPSGIQPLFAELSHMMGPSEAEHQIMECLGLSLWEAQRSGQMPDERKYLECIRKIKKV